MSRLIIGAIVAATLATPAQVRTPWCGIYARKHLVASDPGPAFNPACEWLEWGSPTSPHVGAPVIWRRAKGRGHIGKTTGTDANENFLITSGNDGGAVRTRARSITGTRFRE